MIRFVDAYRKEHGVMPEACFARWPICRVIKIAPSTYHAHAHRRANPEASPNRVRRDGRLRPEIRWVFDENYRVYGARKVWRQLLREGHKVARCTVERLMHSMGLQGAIRGKRVRTTIQDEAVRHGEAVLRMDVRATTSTGSSSRQVQTRFGCPTSPMSRHGRASSTWRS